MNPRIKLMWKLYIKFDCGRYGNIIVSLISAPIIKFCRNLGKIFETSIFQKNVLMFETKISQISWLWCGDITAPCVKSACDFGIEIHFSENFEVAKCHHQCMRKVLRVAKLIIFDFVHFRQLFEKNVTSQKWHLKHRRTSRNRFQTTYWKICYFSKMAFKTS